MKTKERIYQFVIFIVVFSTTISALSQKRPKRTPTKSSNIILPCNLTIADSPRLRGFHLGQSSKDIANRISGFEYEYANANGSYYGEENIDFKIVHLSGIDQFTDNLGEVDDVNITWQFYEDKLVRLFVTYTEFVPKNLSDFITQVTEKTNLPIKSFKFTDKHKAFLKCDGFTVELFEGQYSKIGWFPEFSQIILEDTSSFAEIDKIVENLKKQRKEEEIRRKNEEIKKKKILKPE